LVLLALRDQQEVPVHLVRLGHQVRMVKMALQEKRANLERLGRLESQVSVAEQGQMALTAKEAQPVLLVVLELQVRVACQDSLVVAAALVLWVHQELEARMGTLVQADHLGLQGTRVTKDCQAA